MIVEIENVSRILCDGWSVFLTQSMTLYLKMVKNHSRMKKEKDQFLMRGWECLKEYQKKTEAVANPCWKKNHWTLAMWEIKLRNISIIDSFNQRVNHAKLFYWINYTSTPQNKFFIGLYGCWKSNWWMELWLLNDLLFEITVFTTHQRLHFFEDLQSKDIQWSDGRDGDLSKYWKINWWIQRDCKERCQSIAKR